MMSYVITINKISKMLVFVYDSKIDFIQFGCIYLHNDGHLDDYLTYI